MILALKFGLGRNAIGRIPCIKEIACCGPIPFVAIKYIATSAADRCIPAAQCINTVLPFFICSSIILYIASCDQRVIFRISSGCKLSSTGILYCFFISVEKGRSFVALKTTVIFF